MCPILANLARTLLLSELLSASVPERGWQRSRILCDYVAGDWRPKCYKVVTAEQSRGVIREHRLEGFHVHSLDVRSKGHLQTISHSSVRVLAAGECYSPCALRKAGRNVYSKKHHKEPSDNANFAS